MSYLKQLFDKYGCDKGYRHAYHTLYEPEFEAIRHLELNILEVGVLRGESIEAWVEYFPNSLIWGLDTFERVPPQQIPVLSNHRVHTIQGDSQDPKILSEFGINPPVFDIIIDDGEHSAAGVFNTFQVLSTLLRHTGLYYIEDFVPSHVDPHTSVRRLDLWEPSEVSLMIKSIENQYGYHTVLRDSREQSGKDNSVILRAGRYGNG